MLVTTVYMIDNFITFILFSVIIRNQQFHPTTGYWVDNLSVLDFLPHNLCHEKESKCKVTFLVDSSFIRLLDLFCLNFITLCDDVCFEIF